MSRGCWPIAVLSRDRGRGDRHVVAFKSRHHDIHVAIPNHAAFRSNDFTSPPT